MAIQRVGKSRKEEKKPIWRAPNDHYPLGNTQVEWRSAFGVSCSPPLDTLIGNWPVTVTFAADKAKQRLQRNRCNFQQIISGGREHVLTLTWPARMVRKCTVPSQKAMCWEGCGQCWREYLDRSSPAINCIISNTLDHISRIYQIWDGHIRHEEVGARSHSTPLRDDIADKQVAKERDEHYGAVESDDHRGAGQALVDVRPWVVFRIKHSQQLVYC